jgi:trimeric autotransporter adhesin
MNTTYFVRTLIMGLFLFSASSSFASSGITFHGRLLMPDGVTPVSSATTQFRIQIRSPNAENCLLWEEQQTRDLSTTNGTFTLTIADTSEPSLIANVLPYTLERIFSNRTNFTALTGCSVGSTFNPTSGDGRNLQVYFREVPTDPWEQMPLTKINFVPLSLNSVQLAGYDASEFLKIDPLSSYTTLTAANVNTLVDIIAGTNAQYLKPSSAFSGDVTGTSSTTVVEKIRGTNVVATAPTTGQVLKFNGTNWAPAADDTGSTGDASYAAKGIVQINTDQTTSGLFIASGVLAMPNVITAGGPTGGASTVPVITYDQKGRLTAVTTATVDDTTKLPLAGGTMTGPINMGTQNITNATSVAATNFSGRNLILSDNDTNTVTIKTPTDVTADYVLTLPPNDGGAGEVLTTDGSGVLTWGSAGGSSISVTANQAVVANGTGTGLTSFTCSINQVMSFDGTGLPVCGNVTGAGGFIQNGNSYGAAATLGTNDNFDLNFETNGTTKMTVLANGNVGIGTATPGGAKVAIVLSETSNALLQATGMSSTTTYSPTGANSAIMYGMNSLATFNPTGTANSNGAAIGGDFKGRDTAGNSSNLWGIFGSTSQATKQSNGFVSYLIGAQNTASSTTASGTVTEAYGTKSAAVATAATITSAFGMYGQVSTSASASSAIFEARAADFSVSQGAGSTILNGVGVYIGNVQATTKYSLYASDSLAPSYFAGNVGIGTTAPATALDLNGAWSVRGMAAPAVSVAGQGRIYFDSTANKFKVSENNGAYTDLVGSGSADNLGNHTATQNINLSTFKLVGNGGSTGIVINSSGNVGIGTTAPASALHIAKNDDMILEYSTATGTSMPGYIARKSRGTSGSPTAVLSGDALGAVVFSGHDGTNFNLSGNSMIWGEATQNFNPTTQGSNLVFATTTNGTTLRLVRGLIGNDGSIALGGSINKTTFAGASMVISSAGNVGIGTTSPNTQLDITGAFSQRGMAAPAVSVAGQGRIYFDSTANKFKVSENNGAYADLVGSGSADNLGNHNATQNLNLSTYKLVGNGGSEGISIDASGNVGVGTTVPLATLHVTNSASTQYAPVTILTNGIADTDYVLQVRKGETTNNNADIVAKLGLDYLTNQNAGINFHRGSTIGGGFLSFYANGGVERMRLDAGGRVGIGTTSPNTTLDINGAFSQRGMAAPGVSVAGQGRIYFDSTANKFKVSENNGAYADLVGGSSISVTSNQAVVANGTGTGLSSFTCSINQVMSFDGSGLPVCAGVTGTGGFLQDGNSYGAAATLGTNDNYALNFETNGTTKMTVLANGNVGIGTTNPTSPLEISQSSTVGGATAAYGSRIVLSLDPATDNTVNNYGAGSVLNISGTNNASSATGSFGSSGTLLHTGSGTITKGIGAGGYVTNAIGTTSLANAVQGQVSTLGGTIVDAHGGDFSISNLGGTITNGVGVYTGTIQATNKWSLYASDATAPSYFAGNVGIGTTNPVQALDVNGTVQAVDFVSTSDRRLKKDIQPILNALKKLSQITGVSWRWKANGEPDMGVIAQDVEKVFPDLVVTDRNGKKSVKYGNLVGPVIEAVNELSNEVTTLKTENAELKLRLEKIEKFLQANEVKNQAKNQSP